MKWFVFTILFIAAILSLAPTPASGYYNGYVSPAGYAYANGFWYYNSVPYTRAWIAPTYDRYGCYVAGYYEYSRYYAPAAPSVAYTDPNWRSKLLDIAASDRKAEADLMKSMVEQTYFMQATQALGMHRAGPALSYPLGFQGIQGGYSLGGGGYGGYSAPPGMFGYTTTGSYNSTVLSANGAQGNTVYGYGPPVGLSQLFNQTDPALLFQMAGQLGQQSQQNAKAATDQFMGLVNTDQAGRERLASIILKAQAMQQMLSVIDGVGTKQETKGFSFQVKPTQGGDFLLQRREEGVDPQAKAALQKQWIASAAKCIDCHGDKSERKFKVADYPSYTPEQKQTVWERLVTNDPQRKMPKQADGTPGDALPAAEVRLWMLN